ncbi:hypothetical protein N7541_007743 [Penicillium brevicompactum]|uniref:Uncharacterized protein n=1 Tax=Penicillium brevicompactum TaxID=5074 RepID=A0A9W9QXQ9_PENBR|nr:hypothetical protein N7541_007743 [Penicillium brevicompactum]
MRNRFTFSRSTSLRTRASTVSREPESPESRPRSATNPESPTYNLMEHNNSINPSKGYEFTDEIGYFRPASPLISRQEIHEDVVADVKHACALLSHSIERGIPAGLSYQSTIPNWTVPNLSGKPKSRPTGKRKPGSRKAEKPTSLDHPVPVPPIPKPIEHEPETTKKHDSGVGMNYESPKPNQTGRGRPHGNSTSGTVSSARFYNKQSSTTSGSPSEHRARSRSRSPSLTGSIQLEPQQLSISSSNIPSQYSPQNSQSASTDPTLDSPVSPLNEADKQLQALETKLKSKSQNTNQNPNQKSTPISPSVPNLSSAPRTWPSLANIKNTPTQTSQDAKENKKAKTSSRFYSGSNATTSAFDSREWLTKTFWEDRYSVYGESTLSLGMSGTASRRGSGTPRMGSVSTTEEANYPYGTWAATRGMSYSSTCLADEFKHQENVYSCVVQPRMSEVPRGRREKASLLLRKLAGLRMGRREREREVEV